MADISKITTIDGTTYNIKDETARANGKVSGVKGSAESSYRTGNVNLTAANVGAVATSGNETVAGNKTFSGTTVLSPASTYTVSTGTVIPANAAAIIQSPIPKYLWHDIIAFNRAKVPKYYTSSDGTTWTEATLEKRLFIHKENWGSTTVLNSTTKAVKWEWISAGFYASSAAWLVIGIPYTATMAHFDLLMETSSDGGTTWTSMFSVENLYYNSIPIWIRIGGTMQNSLRLTLSWNDASSSTASLPICSIRCLTARWGNQGQGSELEYPYDWDADANVLPFYNNSQSLGSSSVKWANVYATSFSGSGASLTALNGSNISSGTVAAARIADLAANKITSGTFDTARIPDLAASKITSGTIDAARLPTVSTTAAGIMSASDKTKLDGLENPVAITNAEIDAITG